MSALATAFTVSADGQAIENTPAFSYYRNVEATKPDKALTLADLVALCVHGPTVGPKDKAAALTPFIAQGKKKEHAAEAKFHSLVSDHDDDDKSRNEIAATYDPWNVAHLVYTSASHQQDKKGIIANRWKNVIPFSRPADFERWSVLSNGLMLLNGTDPAQSRGQQVFFAPNVIEEGAPFEFIDRTERPLLDPYDDRHPLIEACLKAYEQETRRKEGEARKAAPKPRPASMTARHCSIIEMAKAAYTPTGILDGEGYRQIGRRYLSPWSTTGTPGVIVLGDRVYSHHGDSDPLSSLNHPNQNAPGKYHSLDAFDMLVALRFSGDFSRAVAKLADELDPQGQKERRQAHEAAKEAAEEAEKITETVNADPEALDAVDLFGSMEPPPFPLDLLPPAIADYARDQSELIGVDPAIVALTAIGSAAACIDDRIEIQPKRHDTGWREQARLWIATIGDPSAKKSPGIKKAMAPLFKIDQQWRAETAKARADWQKQCDDTPKEEEPPPPPIGKRLILNDATVEKMADIMSQCEPRGMLSYQDELSGWLASMDAYKNGAGGKDKAAWLEAYNGGPKAVDRIGRGSSFVENWSACVIGGIQPSVVQSYAQSSNHDGMLQRFILVKAGEAPLGQDREPNGAAVDAYHRLMVHLAGTIAAGHTIVTLSEDAHKAREVLDSKLHRIVCNHPNKFLTAALGKWSGLFARLLLTFHCVEMASRGEYPTVKPVSGETAQSVSELIWRTLLPHAVSFYQGLDPTEDTARELASLVLAQKWERFSVKRDLNRYWKASRKLKPWELEETLDRLEAFGWIFPEPGRLNEKGRPAAYVVNPGVHRRFTEQAARERERRAEVAALMADLKG